MADYAYGLSAPEHRRRAALARQGRGPTKGEMTYGQRKRATMTVMSSACSGVPAAAFADRGAAHGIGHAPDHPRLPDALRAVAHIEERSRIVEEFRAVPNSSP